MPKYFIAEEGTAEGFSGLDLEAWRTIMATTKTESFILLFVCYYISVIVITINWNKFIKANKIWRESESILHLKQTVWSSISYLQYSFIFQ